MEDDETDEPNRRGKYMSDPGWRGLTSVGGGGYSTITSTVVEQGRKDVDPGRKSPSGLFQPGTGSSWLSSSVDEQNLLN